MSDEAASGERILEICGLVLCGLGILAVVSLSGTALLLVEPLAEIWVAFGAACAVAGAVMIVVADRRRRARGVVLDANEKTLRGFGRAVLSAFAGLSFLLGGVCSIAQFVGSVVSRGGEIAAATDFWSGVIYVGGPIVTAIALMVAVLAYSESGV